MKCLTCGVVMVETPVTAEAPYAYTQSGLDNVSLAGITLRECPQCCTKSPVIPRTGELHRLIADWLISKNGRLGGKELKFLRKNVGLSGKEFARLLGVAPEHLSRIENGVVEFFGDSNDQHARLILKAWNDKVEREYLLQIADKVEKKSKKIWSIQPFTLEGGHWKLPKAA